MADLKSLLSVFSFLLVSSALDLNILGIMFSPIIVLIDRNRFIFYLTHKCVWNVFVAWTKFPFKFFVADDTSAVRSQDDLSL